MRVKVVLEKEGDEKDVTPYVKDILLLLAAGGVLTALAVAPGLARLLPRKEYPERNQLNDKRWKRFNIRQLRRNLKRLEKQKDITIVYENGFPFFKLTRKGMLRASRYNLSDLALNEPTKWDKKWRLIIYDIPDEKRAVRNEIRHLFTQMKILQLQKSVYLTPYPCEDQIEFIREYFGVGECVQVLTVSRLEKEKAFRGYFGL